MKESNIKTFFLIIFLMVLFVLVYVSTRNILDSKKNETSYATIATEVDKKITNIEKNNDSVEFNLNNDVHYYCVKSTKTTPTVSSLCWTKTNLKSVNIGLIIGKKYYLWIMDDDKNISNIIILK